jgi:hypothetical protein
MVPAIVASGPSPPRVRLRVACLEDVCLAFRGVRRPTRLREILTYDWSGAIAMP